MLRWPRSSRENQRPTTASTLTRTILDTVAFNYINTHGKDLHGEPLGKYFIHGLGHSVGIDVHDPMDYSKPIPSGAVFTIEPGIYIPEEKLGIRIEDIYRVDESGKLIDLTAALAHTPDEVEAAMKSATVKILHSFLAIGGGFLTVALLIAIATLAEKRLAPGAAREFATAPPSPVDEPCSQRRLRGGRWIRDNLDRARESAGPHAGTRAGGVVAKRALGPAVEGQAALSRISLRSRLSRRSPCWAVGCSA